MPRRLKDLMINAVALCEQGANDDPATGEGARIRLVKRRDDVDGNGGGAAPEPGTKKRTFDEIRTGRDFEAVTSEVFELTMDLSQALDESEDATEAATSLEQYLDAIEDHLPAWREGNAVGKSNDEGGDDMPKPDEKKKDDGSEGTVEGPRGQGEEPAVDDPATTADPDTTDPVDGGDEPATAEKITKMEEENEQLRETTEKQAARIEKLERENLRKECRAKAEEIPYYPGKTEEVVDELMELHERFPGEDGAEEREKRVAKMEKINEQLAASKAFQVVGAGSGQATVVEGAQGVADEVRRKAEEKMANDPDLTPLDARKRVLDENRELQKRYREEVG